MHSDVVAKLKAMAVEHQKTGIPQATPETQNTTRCWKARTSNDVVNYPPWPMTQVVKLAIIMIQYKTMNILPVH